MLKSRILYSPVLAAALVALGCGMLEDQMGAAIAENAVVLDHLGDVIKVELDYERTAAEPGENVFALRVDGTKGSGLVVAEFISVSADEEEIASGVLEMDSGEVFDLLPSDS